MINILITQKLNELTNKQIILLDKEIIRLEKLIKSIKYKNSDIIKGVNQESFYIKYNNKKAIENQIIELFNMRTNLENQIK